MNRQYLPLFEDATPSNGWEKYRANTETIITVPESIEKINSFIKENYISEEDLTVFRKILNDPQILSKLVWVRDGSYRNNRLFFKRFNFKVVDQPAFLVECAWLYKNKENDYWNMPADDKIKFIKDNYEYIFIDLVPDNIAQLENLLFDTIDMEFENDYEPDPDDDYYTRDEWSVIE